MATTGVEGVDVAETRLSRVFGIPPALPTNLVACARMPDWIVYIMEQRRNNRLIGPRATYVGPEPRSTGRGPET